MKFNKLCEEIRKQCNMQDVSLMSTSTSTGTGMSMEYPFSNNTKKWITDSEYGLGLDNSDDIFKKENINKQDNQGRTILIIIARLSDEFTTYDDSTTIKHLLEDGADPNIKDKIGRTALDYAKIRKSYRVQDVLQRAMH